MIIVTIWNSVAYLTFREFTFFKKVSINKIFSESTLYRFEMNALEKDPIDGD